MGLFGIPQKRDDWSLWLDTVYGGERMQYVFNLFYSNGNWDPWSPAGVASSMEVLERKKAMASTYRGKHGEELSRINSVTIDRGRHYLDLFFPSAEDPQSVM